MGNTKELALIMKGGGIKGLAYVGALEELSKHYDFTWYAGTSAGAISAILLASGYTHEELKTILQEKDFRDFKDAGFIKKFYNLFTKSGLYEANTFTIWLDQLLAKKLKSPVRIELKDLPNRATVYASRRGKEALVFDSEDPTRSEESAAFTARCSMAIPFIFTPQSSEGLRVFDGGAQNNYPVNQLLQDNPNTDFIGLYLGTEHFEGHEKKSVFSELLSIWTESSDVAALQEHADKTVIIDPRPISTLKFSLTQEEKQFLLECGRIGALNFLNEKDKIELDEDEFEVRKRKLESKREKLQKSVTRKKRNKKFILWVFLVIIAFTVYWNWDRIFPPKAKFFAAKIELKNSNNKALKIEQGALVLNINGVNVWADIDSKGSAIIDSIPIDMIGMEINEINVKNPNRNLIYIPILKGSKYKIDRLNKYVTVVEIYLKGSDTIWGKVIDSKNDSPLNGVKVKVLFNDSIAITNSEGKYSIKIPAGQIPEVSEIIKLEYSLKGYKIETKSIEMPRTQSADIIMEKIN